MQKVLISFLAFTLHFNLFSQVSEEQAQKFSRVMDIINMFYVDTVQEEKLVEKAIISVLKELDPHSTYISRDEVRELNEPLIGSFDGIGITYNILHDTVYIISTFQGGPSERLGIKPGDRIISIDDNHIAGIGIKPEKVKSYLLGSKGTFVSLLVKPNGSSGLTSFVIPREQIPIVSIDAAYQVNNGTAYIKLNRFSATSPDEFLSVAAKLKKKGVENLILDLRDNGGGYLKSATDLADQFLSDNKLIVYTEGTSSSKSEYFANNKGLFEKGKLVVLINEGTASASEIVSGAIQDWDKGLLIGRRSFGKGLVQRPFTLVDGSLIRLTIARYYTPTGRLIQKPYNEGFDKYSGDLKQRLNHGEFFHADSIHFSDSLKFYTLKNKRLVYGSGGIMPDVFVPLDTTLFPVYYQNIMKNGKLSEFVLDYIDKNRNYFNRNFPQFDIYKTQYQVGNDLVKKIIVSALTENSSSGLLADNHTGTPDNFINQADLINKQVKNHMKALIAQNLYGNAEYYEIINQTDQIFLKALEIISNDNQYYTLLGNR
jgi:carboxyl-terminal processing protease